MSAVNLIKMVNAHSIPGGIHPEQHKSESNKTPIVLNLPLPPTLWLPLKMHIGTPANACVAIGERVLKGQIIATAQNGISANIHAPTSGVVSRIEEYAFAHESGFKQPAVEITPDGLDEWRDKEPWGNWLTKSTDELLARIRDCGVAGMGGAGFPTDIKYQGKNERPIHTLLINAAECEPYITSDDRQIRERAEEILQGAKICLSLLNAHHILIGIEDNKPEGIEAFKQASKALNIDVSIVVVPTKYPSGGEKQLIQLTTGLEVPKKGLPSDVGIVCQNVGTLTQIYRAVVLDEPLIHRVTTLTGEGVGKPGNYQTLIGTPIQWLLEQAEFNANKADRVIMGGPMMGFIVPDTQAPVIKTTNCLLVPSQKELPPPMPDNPCIRCGLCEQACPVDLLPQQLLWASKNRQLESAELHSIDDCIECGACAYVCPSQIPLVQYFRYAKGEIKQERADAIKSENARIRFENRQARLDQEKREKERKRKERAAAAAKSLAEKQSQQGADQDDSQDKIKAALARAAQKKAVKETPFAEQSEEALKIAAEKAKTKHLTAIDRLAKAREENPDMVTALEKAASKLKEKADVAEKAVIDVQNPSGPKT